jgi:hypothetical protein
MSTRTCTVIKPDDHKNNLSLSFIVSYLTISLSSSVWASETYPIKIQINSEYIYRFRKSKEGRELYKNADKLKE